jgi:DNA-binding NtrC family response regulator
MSRGHILIVDDDRAMVRTLRDVLRLAGWEAEGAHSAEEAVERVRERPFGLILMDIKMPGMNGVDGLRRIREMRPDARVILMTAYSASELVNQAIEAGALEVLSKPIVLPHLVQRVEEAASERRPILVVDDDPAFLETLCASLESHGVHTVAARSVPEAISLLDEESVRVVVLDLKLEGVSGTDGVLAIKNASPEVLFVLFTGYPKMLDEVEAAVPDRWVVASLLKPFDPARLIDILERADGN